MKSIFHKEPDWVAGGIYSVAGYSEGFNIVKIVALEAGIVHIKVFKERFSERPKAVMTAELSIGTIHDDEFGMMHLPRTATLFDEWQPKFIACEDVAEKDLEGYKTYLEYDPTGGSASDVPPQKVN